MNVFDLKVLGNSGEEINLNQYKGQVLLIINSATECGFTPQYNELRDIYDKYQQRGFNVLDFPCNQFGGQAPGTNEEIASFCTSKFGIKFPIFSKINVNGENSDPLFKYLRKQKKFEGFNPEHPLYEILDGVLKKVDPDYINNSDIKWNFTKFLIDQKGDVVARFEPTADMKVIETEIEKLL